MEPELTMIEKIQLSFKKKMQQSVCVNASVLMVDNATMQFTLEGCEGMKRNGSKYCQKCSDEYHGVRE